MDDIRRMEEETKKELDEVTEYILHCTHAHILTPLFPVE